MIIAKVIGNIWATKKDESLEGLKFFVVRQIGAPDAKAIVAVDGGVGAGIGDDVLVTQGSSARMIYAKEHRERPVDAVIVGVIDSLEVDREQWTN